MVHRFHWDSDRYSGLRGGLVQSRTPRCPASVDERTAVRCCLLCRVRIVACVPSWETTDGGAGAVAGVVVFTVIVTTFAGVVFALLRIWSKSIVAPILAHAASNSFSYLAAIVALELID